MIETIFIYTAKYGVLQRELLVEVCTVLDIPYSLGTCTDRLLSLDMFEGYVCHFFNKLA